MSDSKKTIHTISLGFGDVLTIVFIVLKLCKVITWSWWWVFSPIWIPLAVILFLLLVLWLL